MLKFRERDIIDYVGLVLLLFTIAQKVLAIGRVPELKQLVGTIVMFMVLSGVAVFELKEHASGNKIIVLPMYIAIPMTILVILISGLTLPPRQFLESLLGGGAVFILLLVMTLLWRRFFSTLGFDQGTIIVGFVA